MWCSAMLCLFARLSTLCAKMPGTKPFCQTAACFGFSSSKIISTKSIPVEEELVWDCVVPFTSLNKLCKNAGLKMILLRETRHALTVLHPILISRVPYWVEHSWTCSNIQSLQIESSSLVFACFFPGQNL